MMHDVPAQPQAHRNRHRSHMERNLPELAAELYAEHAIANQAHRDGVAEFGAIIPATNATSR